MDENELATTIGLLGTTDAMVWAKEFCRIFAGWKVSDDDADEGEWDEGDRYLGPGTMVAWFAPAIEVGKARGSEMARREIADQHRGEVDESFQPEPIRTGRLSERHPSEQKIPTHKLPEIGAYYERDQTDLYADDPDA